jgi:hypothetical protein
MSSSPEYHYWYNKARHKRVKAKIFDILGNKCQHCGSLENLQIDHIDPKRKAFDISSFWAYAWNDILEELKKCQALCENCHRAKTLIDLGQENARFKHGTLSSYRYCRCNECKAAKNKYSREYKRKRRLSSIGSSATPVK